MALRTHEPDTQALKMKGVMRPAFRADWPYIAIIVGLFLAGQWPTMGYWWHVWTTPESEYAHGPIVPFLGAIMVWQVWPRLRSNAGNRTWAGIPIVGAALMAFAFGRLLSVHQLLNAAFLMLCVGLILGLWGKRTLRLVLIPLVFLVATAAPWSDTLLSDTTAAFQLQSSQIAAQMLRLCDDSVACQGNIIYSDHLPAPLVIGGACSGLKLLIASSTVSLFLAIVLRGTWWRKLILVAMALPFTILVNSLRVALIGAVGYRTQSVDAMHAFHNWSGYAGLAVCSVLLYTLAWILRIRPPGRTEDEPSAFTRLPRSRRDIYIMGILLALAGLWVLASTLRPLYGSRLPLIGRSRLPATVGAWTGYQVGIDADTAEKLQPADIVSLLYQARDGTAQPIYVFVEAGYDAKDFHDPYVCLPGGGLHIRRDEIVLLPASGNSRKVRRGSLLHVSGQRGDVSAILYWYDVQNHRSIATNRELWHYFRDTKLTDLMRIAHQPFALSAIRQEVNSQSRQVTWYRFSTALTDEPRDVKNLIRFASQFVAQYEGSGR